MSLRTIVITGASDGIGAAAADALAARGDRVVVIGRSAAKTGAVAQQIGAPHYVTDFSDLAQVRTLAAQLQRNHPRIDVLVNNAGAITDRFTRTRDGFEQTFQVNHLAPFLLTNLLMPTLAASRATIITTASDAARLGHIDLDDLGNEGSYQAKKAYGDSKLGNILFTAELQRRFAGTGINAVAFHPGNVASNFAADTTTNWRLVYATPLRHLALTSPKRSAERLVRLATTRPGQDWTPGQFYVKNKIGHPNPQADNLQLAEDLWNCSVELTGLTTS